MADISKIKIGNTTYNIKASNVPTTFGTAAQKDYTTSIASGNTGLPTSETVYTALANKADNSTTYTKAQTDTLLSGKADLENGKVLASQLPSYVDDVLEYATTSAFPATGESGKIYIATKTNKTYRWSGSKYVEISQSLALGETSSTAYAGNKGKANADAIAKKPGEITTGKQYIIDGENVTASEGAETFNDLTGNRASGPYSHAEGSGTTAYGIKSHAEGNSTTASGPASHTEGNSTTASGQNSHAEGFSTTASSAGSHAEGENTTASGQDSHAEGHSTTASGSTSHAEGLGTRAESQYQHVQGKYNVADSSNTYAFIIGNGNDVYHRHNAFAIDWDGRIYVNGASTGVNVYEISKSLVDRGAKNMFPINAKVMGSSGNIVSQSFILDPGVYVFAATMSGTGSTQLKFTVGSSTGETVATYSWGNSSGSISQEYVISQKSTWVTMYTNAAVTYSNMMLCRKSDYEVSPAYVPYAPTNRELYNDVNVLNQRIESFVYNPNTSKSIILSRASSATFLALGFVQGIGNIYWILEIDGSGNLTVKNGFDGSTVSAAGISFNKDTKTLTFTSQYNGNSNITIIMTSV